MKIEGDLVDIRLRAILKVSFDSKNDYSLVKILQTNLVFKKLKINLESLISDYLTFFPQG